MDNFEHYRKKAKRVLRWHRARHWTVAEQIRASLPRFQSLSDDEIFSEPFKLADAQALVASQTGFESWKALKRALETGYTGPPRPEIAFH
ncbi:MAG: hypothetical protein AAF493_11645 [Pseudomonadota bacterium]